MILCQPSGILYIVLYIYLYNNAQYYGWGIGLQTLLIKWDDTVLNAF
jgi:hypothetical protein